MMFLDLFSMIYFIYDCGQLAEQPCKPPFFDVFQNAAADPKLTLTLGVCHREAMFSPLLYALFDELVDGFRLRPPHPACFLLAAPAFPARPGSPAASYMKIIFPKSHG